MQYKVIKGLLGIFMLVCMAGVVVTGISCKKETERETIEEEIGENPAQDLRMAKITGSSVNARRGPGIDYKVAFQLDKGDEVKILGMDASEKGDTTFDECEWIGDDEGNYTPPYAFESAIMTAAHKVDEYFTLAKGMAVRVCYSYDPGGHGWVHVEFVAEGKRDTFGLHDKQMVDFRNKVKKMGSIPWYKVETEDDQKGWVYGEFVKPD